MIRKMISIFDVQFFSKHNENRYWQKNYDLGLEVGQNTVLYNFSVYFNYFVNFKNLNLFE